MGFIQVLLELDSKVVTQMLVDGVDKGQPCSSFVKAIRLILAPKWTIQIVHAY